MSIAVFFDQKNPEKWIEELQKELPDVLIEAYPEISDRSEVSFAVCWKPPQSVLSTYPNLQIVQSIGAGVDHILNSQQLGSGVQLTRIVDPELSKDLYEYVLAGILSHLRDFPTYQHHQVHQKWHSQRYRKISETTVTVLGLGAIGAFIAENLAKMGFVVRGWSRNVKQITGVTTFSESELMDAVQHTNVLVNVLPLTPATTEILDNRLLSQLAPNGYLINVGRGAHLKEDDLLELIKKNHLSGALLDVFKKEPLPDNHPFWQTPQINITPHVASITSRANAVSIIVENWHRYQQNKPLLHEVELNLGY